jgi:hypothetical protein
LLFQRVGTRAVQRIISRIIRLTGTPSNHSRIGMADSLFAGMENG